MTLMTMEFVMMWMIVLELWMLWAYAMALVQRILMPTASATQTKISWILQLFAAQEPLGMMTWVNALVCRRAWAILMVMEPLQRVI